MEVKEKVDFLEGRIKVLSAVVRVLSATDLIETGSFVRAAVGEESGKVYEQETKYAQGVRHQASKILSP